MPDLVGDIKKRLTLGESEAAIKADLLSKGNLEDDVEIALSQTSSSSHRMKVQNELNERTRIFSIKEVFDRLAFGFGSGQFINIFLFQTGASLFLIGILNGLKSLLDTFYSSYLTESLTKIAKLKSRMVLSGIIHALSFLAFGVSISIGSVALFAVSFIVGGLAGVLYGNSYHALLDRRLGEQKTSFLQKHATIGLFLAGMALVIGGYILDFMTDGYLLVFMIIFFSLLIAIISLLGIREKVEPHHEHSIRLSMGSYISGLFSDVRPFFTERAIIVLLLTGSITSFVQILGYSYYGVFIFEQLDNQGFGPFLNVALIFVFALLGSFVGNFITQSNSKEYGKFPMLVFGTILMAIMPLTFFYNPHLVSIGMAAILGIVGSSIVGIARSILAVDLIPQHSRGLFFKLSGLIASLPLILFIPLGAWYAETYYFRKLFLVLGLILIIIVVPMYMYILIAHNKKTKI